LITIIVGISVIQLSISLLEITEENETNMTELLLGHQESSKLFKTFVSLFSDFCAFSIIYCKINIIIATPRKHTGSIKYKLGSFSTGIKCTGN
jgi:hypothetical protein